MSRLKLLSRLKLSPTGAWLIAASVLVGLLVAPFALAAGEGGPLLGGQRNPGTGFSSEYTKETEVIAYNATYGTRQSNKGSGGGAIYGCRSRTGGTPTGNEPCLRATNLSTGLAFEYSTLLGTLGGTITVANGGDAVKPFTTNATGVATGLNADRLDGKDVTELVAVGGTITVAKGGDAVKPFTTNATGVATGLNADRLDGKDATELIAEASPWAKVSSTGALTAKRGAVTSASGAGGNYVVVFSSDISACAFTATVSDGGGVAAFAAQADNRTVNVTTYDLGAAAAVAHPFHLVASC